MPVTKIKPYGATQYVQLFWEDTWVFLNGWGEDHHTFVDVHDVEDNPEHYYGPKEPEWYMEAFGEL